MLHSVRERERVFEKGEWKREIKIDLKGKMKKRLLRIIQIGKEIKTGLKSKKKKYKKKKYVKKWIRKRKDLKRELISRL